MRIVEEHRGRAESGFRFSASASSAASASACRRGVAARPSPADGRGCPHGVHDGRSVRLPASAAPARHAADTHGGDQMSSVGAGEAARAAGYARVKRPRSPLVFAQHAGVGVVLLKAAGPLPAAEANAASALPPPLTASASPPSRGCGALATSLPLGACASATCPHRPRLALQSSSSLDPSSASTAAPRVAAHEQGGAFGEQLPAAWGKQVLLGARGEGVPQLM